MKTILTTLLILCVKISFAQDSSGNYKSDLDFGNGTVFTTFLEGDIDTEKFTITSPKNADVRMFGSKARLARILGKSPKKGIIITITGEKAKDSLFGNANIPMIGKIIFKGIANDEQLNGQFLNENKESIGALRGIKSTQDRIDYRYLYPQVIEIIENNIYSKDAIRNKDWIKFKEKTEKLFGNARDDIELFLGFNILAQQLPFTHLNLFITQDATNSEQSTNQSKSVVFAEKGTSTAYLQIKNFSDSKDELAEVLPKIVSNSNYKNLIVDLRNNGGGGIDAAFEFAKYIVNKDLEVGYFVTNKLKYSGFQPSIFSNLPELQPKSTKAFGNELRKVSGVKLIFKKPNSAVFTGTIYVLTNGSTASTCEPIVYALKNTNGATIIGEKTAGAMLAAFPYNVAGKYTVILPIADFYTFDGVRLDKVGVTPNIEVKSDEALERALELINNDKTK